VDISGAEWVALQFTDLGGAFHEVHVRSNMIDEDVFEEGLGKLDGSSVRGFGRIEESDFVLKPVADTWVKFPWREDAGRFICTVHVRGGKDRLQRDPRLAAERVEEHLRSQGLRSLVAAEPEFFVFNSMVVRVEQGLQVYRIDSEEAPWSSNRGVFLRPKEAYYPTPPFDRTLDYRLKLAGVLSKLGVEVLVTHHEVASAGQIEVNFKPGGVVRTADNLQTLKYAARILAYQEGLTVTFMPKPLAGDNGSGLHVHISLWRGDENIFYDGDDSYAELSQYARYFIGGLLEHARSLAAIANPTTNSYRRLVPGFEAPVYVAWGKSNRSAMIRIPFYHGSKPRARRIELRSPDPSANPYLLFPAAIMAGLDGVRRSIEPGDPVDRNLYSLSPGERRRLGVGELPRSLWEALDELESDHGWLRPVFPEEMIEAYIELKRDEARRIAGTPSPIEAYYYAGI